MAVERALTSTITAERESVFAALLPELISHNAFEATRIVETCSVNEACDELTHRFIDAWTAIDADAALHWIEHWSNEERRNDAARYFTDHLARFDRASAFEAAERLNVGHNDGSLEHLMQIWVAENPTAAQRWIEAQPPSPRRDQLLARFEFARSDRTAASASVP
jgi:hypothetical protein